MKKPELLFDYLLLVFLAGLIGARLWFVALNWTYFAENPSEILAIWLGGQSIQGGVFLGVIAGFLLWLKEKENLPSFGDFADAIAPGLTLGQAVGRWGNFFNIEAFGSPTSLPWGLYVPAGQRPEAFLKDSFFHPTFAYESIYLVFMAGVSLLLPRFIKLKAGSVFALYVLLYSLGRFFLEMQRTDSLMLMGFPAAQGLALFFGVLALCVLVFLQIAPPPQTK